MSSGLEDSSLFDLFRMEAEEQVNVLQNELLLLGREGATAARLQNLMRASHSIKGAARIVGLDTIVHLTHAMEDRFVAAQGGKALASVEIDRLLAATEWLAKTQLAQGEISAIRIEGGAGGGTFKLTVMRDPERARTVRPEVGAGGYSPLHNAGGEDDAGLEIAQRKVEWHRDVLDENAEQLHHTATGDLPGESSPQRPAVSSASAAARTTRACSSRSSRSARAPRSATSSRSIPRTRRRCSWTSCRTARRTRSSIGRWWRQLS